MRIRTVHLASLLLLLATFGVADAAGLRAAAAAQAVPYMAALLTAQTQAEAVAAMRRDAGEAEPQLRASDRAALRSAWTMQPGAAQAVQMMVVTARAA